jgi:probable F420-dependent oxidoreductase
MRLDVLLPPASLKDVPTIATAVEGMCFDGLWAPETQHDPFLSLALVAEHTDEIRFGTAVAIAFARSPANVAHTAWDLAAASQGRFILGLGTQVKPHIERRFGMTWPDSPVGKLREFVLAVRSFWSAWQGDERLNYRGEYYKLNLMTPFFDPGPIEHPDIPIYLAGVNPGMCRLTGEVADGFHVHPLHTERYLREVVRPAIAEGAGRVGRNEGNIQLSTSTFIVTNPQQDAFVRSQIAFYASTPSYRRVMSLHGWDDAAEKLTSLARKGEWDGMPDLVDDEMLATFALVEKPDALASAIKQRYEGLVDRITPYQAFSPGDDDAFWQVIVDEWKRT